MSSAKTSRFQACWKVTSRRTWHSATSPRAWPPPNQAQGHYLAKESFFSSFHCHFMWFLHLEGHSRPVLGRWACAIAPQLLSVCIENIETRQSASDVGLKLAACLASFWSPSLLNLLKILHIGCHVRGNELGVLSDLLSRSIRIYSESIKTLILYHIHPILIHFKAPSHDLPERLPLTSGRVWFCKGMNSTRR